MCSVTSRPSTAKRSIHDWRHGYPREGNVEVSMITDSGFVFEANVKRTEIPRMRVYIRRDRVGMRSIGACFSLDDLYSADRRTFLFRGMDR
jgi:hypothetical protein